MPRYTLITMKKILISLVALSSVLAMQSAIAASPKEKNPKRQFGNWVIVRSVDPMTDAVKCEGRHLVNPKEIQLSGSTLFIATAGGVRSLTIRFGDEPAEEMRLPTQLESRVGAFLIEGDEFEKAMTTKRVRAKILTMYEGVKTIEFDSTGIDRAVEHINAGCPLA